MLLTRCIAGTPRHLRYRDGGFNKPIRGVSAMNFLFNGQRYAVHDSAVAVVVVERIVLPGAIVPEGERAGLPLKAAGQLGSDLMPEQELEQRRAFLLGHTGEAGGMPSVDVQRPASGFGMCAHDRVLGDVCFGGV